MSRPAILLAAFVAVVVLAVVVLAMRSALARRPEGLGVRTGRLAPCPASPNCVSSQASDAGHRVAPLSLAGLDPAAAMARARDALTSMPRVRVVTATDTYLHAEATSRLFRFVDDLELWIDVESGLMHVRSASRVGHSDLGVNRARVESLRARLAAPSR